MMRSRLLAITGLVSFALATSALAVAQSSDTLSPKGTALSATKTQIKSTGTKPTHHQSPPPPGAVRPTGTVTIPASSNKTAKGFAHTNIEIFVPKGQPSIAIPGPAVPVSQFVETPASLGCVYNVGPQYAGCNPATGRTNHPTGGWGAIALVDAFDNPSAGPDLVFFSKSMGLAPIILDPFAGANFHKISADTRWGDPLGLGWTASCSTGVGYPPPDPGWGLEEDLDIEYAHAMAPSATILLVEACSNSYQDLFFAEIVAQILIEDYYPGGDISNSWSGGEDPAQLGDWSLLPASGWDNVFYRFAPPNTTFFASAGDFGWGAGYPSTNPWVISAGGTSVWRDRIGNYLAQGCWGNLYGASGGGPSAVEIYQDTDIEEGPGPWTNYQYQLFGGTPGFTPARDTPDIAFDADPLSGVYVYDGGLWYIVGGTSVSSPSLAGIVNNANNRFSQFNLTFPEFYTPEELNYIYSQQDAYTTFPANWSEVTFGDNGACSFGICPGIGVAYNECTGLGFPLGKLGK